MCRVFKLCVAMLALLFTLSLGVSATPAAANYDPCMGDTTGGCFDYGPLTKAEAETLAREWAQAECARTVGATGTCVFVDISCFDPIGQMDTTQCVVTLHIVSAIGTHKQTATVGVIKHRTTGATSVARQTEWDFESTGGDPDVDEANIAAASVAQSACDGFAAQTNGNCIDVAPSCTQTGANTMDCAMSVSYSPAAGTRQGATATATATRSGGVWTVTVTSGWTHGTAVYDGGNYYC